MIVITVPCIKKSAMVAAKPTTLQASTSQSATTPLRPKKCPPARTIWATSSATNKVLSLALNEPRFQNEVFGSEALPSFMAR